MRHFNNILNLLIPDNLVHLGFELADRRHRQHILGIVFMALCTLVIQANMGQAGIGTIDQGQVSNYRPVPPSTVIAQPQMLFLFFDHHLNCPTLQIAADNFLHRQAQVVRNQGNHITIVPALGEHNFNFAKFIHHSSTLSEFVGGGFTQPLNALPTASSVQNILTVFANFMFGRINSKPAIRLANPDITPFPCFTGIDNRRAKIERIEQNGDIEFLGNFCCPNNLPSQFRKFLEGNLEVLWHVLF